MKRLTLGDVCQKASSNIAQKNLRSNEGIYPIFGASGLIKHIDFYHQEQEYIAVVKDGAGIGRTMLLPAYSSIIGTMQYLLPSADIDIKYLYYAILYMNLAKYFNGATIPHIYFKDYQKEPINIPEINEQQRIAYILEKIDTLIISRKKQIEKLDELVKSRFIEMFGTETEFEKWPCCAVRDIADICVGVVIKPTQYYAKEGVPAFRSLNIREMQVNDDDWVYFTEEGHQKNQKSIVRKNDVLVVRSGAPGTACVVTEKYDGYNAVDIIIAHPDSDKVDSVFLAAFTNMPHGMNQIRERIGGAAQQHFNVGGYKALRLIMPPMGLQKRFATFVEQTDKSKLAIEKNLQKLDILKKSLMQQYFG